MTTDVGDQAAIFLITEGKLHVPVVTLSTEDNEKLSQQSKCGFKRTINWNKYQSRKYIEKPNQYSDCLSDSIFK